MKEEKCFAFDKKTKRKKRSRHLETLSRVERDDGSATLIDAMKKNENLSDQSLRSAPKQLEVMTSNVDVFAADALYHQSCYNCCEEKSITKTEIINKEISVVSSEKEFKILINPIQDRGGQKSPPTSFSPVTSTNVGISPQIFLNFSFNPFATLVQNFKAIPSANLILWNFNQDHTLNKSGFSSQTFIKLRL